VLPLIESVRAAFPTADIHFMAPRRYAGVLSLSIAHPVLRSIERCVSPLLYAPEPPAPLLDPFTGYDRIYSLHGDDDFVSNLRSASDVRHLDPRPTERYIVHHLAKVLAADGIPLADDAPTLMPRGPASAPGTVFLHPGGGVGVKRWPVHNYAPLIGSLRRKHPDGRFVLLAGEAEADIAPVLAPLFDDVLIDAPLETLPALLSGRAYLGMDSGITHLAVAAGADVLALFGPTNPTVWAPRRPNCRVLRGLATLDSDEISARMSSLISHDIKSS